MYFDVNKSMDMVRPDGPVYISRTYKRWNLKNSEFKFDGPVLIEMDSYDNDRYWAITDALEWDNDLVQEWAESHGIDEYDMADAEILMMATELSE